MSRPKATSENPALPKFMGLREAGEYLGLCEASVSRLCRERRITHERIGSGRGRVRITLDALEEFRKASTVAAEPRRT